jgi:hypothetical protein
MSIVVVFLIIIIVISILALIIWKGQSVNAETLFSGHVEGGYLVVNESPKILVSRSISKSNIKYCQSIINIAKDPASKLSNLLTDLMISNIPVDNITVVGYVSGDENKKETIKLLCVINSNFRDVNDNVVPFHIDVTLKFQKYDGLVDLYDMDSMAFVGFDFPIATFDALVQHRNFHKKIGTFLKSKFKREIICENIKSFVVKEGNNTLDITINYNGVNDVNIIIKNFGKDTEEIHVINNGVDGKVFTNDVYTEEQDELTDHIGEVLVKNNVIADVAEVPAVEAPVPVPVEPPVSG